MERAYIHNGSLNFRILEGSGNLGIRHYFRYNLFWSKPYLVCQQREALKVN